MALINFPSTFNASGGPIGELASFGGPVQSVTVTAKTGFAGFVRCKPRKSTDAAAEAPAATPTPAAGSLANGWVPMAAGDKQDFGPLRDEGAKAFYELEIWSTATGMLVIDAGGQ